ncbi:Peptide chain release factor N(5)-glutamine methyltransferase [hydrothermal vent metagenome]|uniref:peptide chain release factor N(5)-glutamine methyltransferase n=1 Tax=hydrothermal vent metagenome TaxID=652676 RepID=A0A3B0TCD6_9ZZZZ
MRSTDLVITVTDLPHHEVVRLAMAATGRSRTEVLVGFEVTPDQVARFETYVERRRVNEPLQYIEGSVPFGPVELLVDDRVLVPRPETEYLFELAISRVDSPTVIVDLCTGSGNLALGLASTFPDATVYAVDLSADAAAVARHNARSNGLDIVVLTGDLYEPLPPGLLGSVDLLVANPPYLAAREVASLPPDVLAEPMLALVAGERGDEVLERIALDVDRWLRPGGVVMCEISEYAVAVSLGHFAHLDAVVEKDLTGTERFVVGHRRTE